MNDRTCAATMELTDEQIERYSRQILLPEIGLSGQKTLLGSSALVVGAGGLGSSALLYLAAAGLGRLGVADDESVELSNLQRQVIHRQADVGVRKTRSAAEAIKRINPDCQVDLIDERLTAANVRQAVRGYNVVLDGSDNFATRFLVSDCCWLEGIALVSAAAVGFEGQLMSVIRGRPCYRCFIPEPPPADAVPTCQAAGIFGPVVGTLGALQAAEAIKLILNIGEPMTDRLLIYNGLKCDFRNVKRVQDPACPLCGPDPTIHRLDDQVYCERLRKS